MPISTAANEWQARQAPPTEVKAPMISRMMPGTE